MQKTKKLLLDELCRLTGSIYISDLSSELVKPNVSQAVHNLSLDDFDSSEWIKAAEYISLNKQHFESAVFARDYLLHLK